MPIEKKSLDMSPSKRLLNQQDRKVFLLKEKDPNIKGFKNSYEKKKKVVKSNKDNSIFDPGLFIKSETNKKTPDDIIFSGSENTNTKASTKKRALLKKKKKDNYENISKSSKLLNKGNLLILQNEIHSLEGRYRNCGHSFCKTKNLLSYNSQRSWFLFELEMCPNNHILKNLRNTCYFEKVYLKLFEYWPMPDTLNNKLPLNYEPFPLDSVLLENIKIPDFNPDNTIGGVNVSLHSFNDTISSEHNYYSNKDDDKSGKKSIVELIPKTFLAQRNDTNIFDLSVTNVRELIRSSSSSSIAVDQEISIVQSDERNPITVDNNACHSARRDNLKAVGIHSSSEERENLKYKFSELPNFYALSSKKNVNNFIPYSNDTLSVYDDTKSKIWKVHKKKKEDEVGKKKNLLLRKLHSLR